MSFNLKNLLGIDPREIEGYVRQIVSLAESMREEQRRLAEFQNLLATHMIRANDRIANIDKRLQAIAAAFDLADCEECPASVNGHVVKTDVG